MFAIHEDGYKEFEFSIFVIVFKFVVGTSVDNPITKIPCLSCQKIVFIKTYFEPTVKI